MERRSVLVNKCEPTQQRCRKGLAMAQRPLLSIFHCHNPGSCRRSAQPSQPPSPGSGTKCSPLLPRCAMEQRVYPPHIHPGQHPLSSSLSTTASAPSPGHRYLHSCSSPSPWLCSASAILGRGGPGLCSTAAVPRSQETASINHRHIHPSPDPGMAIPGWA